MSGLATISARREDLLALSSGPSTTRSINLGVTPPPPSRPRVPDTSRAENYGNGDDVEDEGIVLEVTLALKVTSVLTRRAKEKNDVISRTWVPEST